MQSFFDVKDGILKAIRSVATEISKKVRGNKETKEAVLAELIKDTLKKRIR